MIDKGFRKFREKVFEDLVGFNINQMPSAWDPVKNAALLYFGLVFCETTYSKILI